MKYGQELDFGDDEYQAFVDKFKPKKTTDDCYTPVEVYDSIRKWVCERYGINPESIVRPFYPGGDYENFDYPENCFVLDNPPFSILAKILDFYTRHGIRFFLFAPTLTLFGKNRKCNYIIANASITYENGAVVSTSFVTSEGEWQVEVCPELHNMLKSINDRNTKKITRVRKKYIFPDCVTTSAQLAKLATNGIELKLKKEDLIPIRTLDCGLQLFGEGFLLSDSASAEKASAEKASAEKASAEKASAEKIELSEREKKIQQSIGRCLN